LVQITGHVCNIAACSGNFRPVEGDSTFFRNVEKLEYTSTSKPEADKPIRKWSWQMAGASPTFAETSLGKMPISVVRTAGDLPGIRAEYLQKATAATATSAKFH
jgi:hypothetical protein